MRHFLYFTVSLNCGSVEKNYILIPATNEIRPRNCVDTFFLSWELILDIFNYIHTFVGALLSRSVKTYKKERKISDSNARSWTEQNIFCLE